MTFNEELETRKAIYLEGGFIPLSEVTFEQLTNPKAVVPRQYDFGQLPEKTHQRMLALLEKQKQEQRNA